MVTWKKIAKKSIISHCPPFWQFLEQFFGLRRDKEEEKVVFQILPQWEGGCCYRSMLPEKIFFLQL